MRFRSSNSSTPYMNRASQVRMLMMVLSLGVVIFAIKVTSQPAFWAKIFPEEHSTESQTSNESRQQPEQFIPGQSQLELDEFLANGVDAESREGSEANEDEVTTPPEVSTETDTEVSANQVESVTIPPQFFADAEDFSVGVRSGEAESFFRLLDYTSRVPADEMNRVAIPEAAREVILSLPENYRGRVIQIEGSLRRLEHVDASTNSSGIENYYIGWVITPISDNIPYRIAARFADETLPVKDLIEEEIPVRISGYFYKIQGYHARSDLQLTPLLIAREITRAPASSAPVSLSENSKPARWLFVIFGAIFLLAIWSVYRSTVGATRMRRHRKEVLETEGDLSFIQGQKSIDPGEQLSKLADQTDENASS